MNRNLLVAAVTALVLSWPGVVGGAEESSRGDVIDHGPFDEILNAYVDDEGRVDYEGLRKSKSDREKLAHYVDAVADTPAVGVSKKAQKAFLINAYNALVIREVVERWPVESVLEEEGFFDEKLHGVATGKIALDRLEKEFIHARFGDPRTHFSVVCAAKSCPRLRRTALTEANVDRILDEVTREFVSKTAALVDENTVKVSRLFEWYGEDFGGDDEGVKAFVARYVDDAEIREVLVDDGGEIVFSEYDWGLNGQ